MKLYTMYGTEIRRRPRKGSPGHGFGLVFRGNSENHNPEADFGLGRTEKLAYRNFVFSPDSLCLRLGSIPPDKLSCRAAALQENCELYGESGFS